VKSVLLSLLSLGSLSEMTRNIQEMGQPIFLELVNLEAGDV
jgi:hypothetical protein